MSDTATTVMTYETAPRMNGSDRNNDYVIIAVRNGVALGFKFAGASPYQLPDEGMHAALIFNVRSCRPTETELSKLELGNVTQFGTFDYLSQYWNGFKFTKDGNADPAYTPQSQRASGPLHYFAKGSVSYDADSQTITLPEGLEDGTAAGKIADQLVEIADPGTAVLTREQIEQVVQDHINKLIASMKASVTGNLGLSGKASGSLSKKFMNEMGIAESQTEGDDDNEGSDDDEPEDDDTEELGFEDDDNGSDAKPPVDPMQEANDIAKELGAGGINFVDTPEDGDKSNG